MQFNKKSIITVLALVFAFGLTSEGGGNLAFAAGPAAVNLGTAANFAILGKTAVTDANPTISSITGNVGVSPAAGSSITGLSCTGVIGNIYDVDGTYTGGYNSNVSCLLAGPGAHKTTVDNAVLDMGTAYTAASAPATPAGVGANLNVGSGTLNGQTFAPGVWTWGTNVTIAGDITLSGGANDVWIFQVTGTLGIDAGKKVLLTGGAQASNVFWQVTGATTLTGSSVFEGTILDQTNIAMQASAILHGRALAQTAVTLIGNTITIPTAAAATQQSGRALTCNPATQSVAINQTATFTANGGTGVYTWAAPGGNALSSGNTNAFSASYTTSGTKTVNLRSGGSTTSCTVYVVSAPVPPLISVLKVPTPLALPSGAGSVTYDYTVTDVGVVPMSNITVTDNKCAAVSFVSGDTNGNGKLDTNEAWRYRCSATLAQTMTNTVTATGQANGFMALDTANATVVVGVPVIPPLIHVVKKPNVFVLPAGGGAVTYSYTVTNPGTVPLSEVNIADDKCTGLPGRVAGHPGDLNKNDLLDPGELWQFTCQTNLTQTTTNIGTASGSANGFTAVDSAPALVVVAAPKLPNTGIGPNENNGASWLAVILTGILATLFSLFFARKQQKVL